MVESPKDVLGPVPADTEIDSVPVAVVPLPNSRPGTFPTVCNRVADEDQVDVTLLDTLIELLVALPPVGGSAAPA